MGSGSDPEIKAFPMFLQLPVELRRIIWSFCLPARTEELDVARGPGHFFTYTAPPPCTLDMSSSLNVVLPFISRVCQEARDVALTAGSYLPYEPAGKVESDCWAFKDHHAGKIWRRKSPPPLVHLNWDIHHRRYSDPIGFLASLTFLEHMVTSRKSHGSMCLRHLQFVICHSDDAAELLNRHSKWSIVMQNVVIHAPRSCVASSGLFGLLGDAPLQIVDLSDTTKIDALYKLAQDCDAARPFKSGQDLRNSVHQWEPWMRQTSFHASSRGIKFNTDLRPAVAFRWCPMMCPGPFAPTNPEQKASSTDSH